MASQLTVSTVLLLTVFIDAFRSYFILLLQQQSDVVSLFPLLFSLFHCLVFFLSLPFLSSSNSTISISTMSLAFFLVAAIVPLVSPFKESVFQFTELIRSKQTTYLGLTQDIDSYYSA